MAITNSFQYQNGIVLSGGGARGIAHTGVLQALEERHIFPEVLSGASAGAMVSVLYADGYTPQEIYGLIKRTGFFDLFQLSIGGAIGLFKMDKLAKWLKKHLRAKKFADLSKPVFISVTNYSNATSELWHEGDLLEAVLASSCLPMVFQPQQICGKLYIDGGILNNLPVEPLDGQCQRIIGVNVNPLRVADKIESFRTYADRVVHLGLNGRVIENSKKCDWFMEPEGLAEYQLFDIKKAEAIHRLGYLYASNFLQEQYS